MYNDIDPLLQCGTDSFSALNKSSVLSARPSSSANPATTDRSTVLIVLPFPESHIVGII